MECSTRFRFTIARHMRPALGVLALLAACNSSGGGSNSEAGGAGGHKQGSSGGSAGQSSAAGGTSASSNKGGQGGQSSAAGGTSSALVSTSSQAGRSSATEAGSSGTGGRSTQGGATEARPDAAAGGQGGQIGGTSRPLPDASDTALAGASGSSGSGGGATSTKDASPPDAGEVGHPRRVILVDEGNTRIHLMDLQNSSASIWTKQFSTFRDIQLVGGDRLAVSIQEGYVELDLKDGATKKEFKGLSGIESLRRLPNGNTVLGGNSDGGITLQELDGQDKPVSGHKVTFTGSNYGPLRLMRRTPQGTFLIGFGTEDNELAEVNWDKQILWRKALPSAKHTYQGLRLSDGKIAVSAGYAAAIYLVDPVADKLTTIGGKSQPDAASIKPNFFAGFQVLKNGNFVVTNWQAHGAGHGNEGIQLLEYDRSGKLVWQWKQTASVVSSLHGVLVIDGLDTSKLHDDVNGELGPVTE